ncbi:replication protein A 32 kDa subunit-A [Aplysia californica]|uniref:Replication protein A 32 kDa subunit-A n=1 Tax=Aplysia californica TaxID=6500 RepID=A0ABM1A0I1_APLCA|nr:replication protein A 32 kDa subunit-A [Aplysia californica]
MWNNQDFNSSGFGQGGGFNTPQGDEKKKSGKRSNNIVPVTIAQILTAKHEDDVFVSKNLELFQITFVGLIKAVNESATRIDYEIDDMSGPPIEVRHFNETEENEDGSNTTSNALPVNTYVRVNGLVRAFGGKRSVNCHKISPITDMNEMTCHMLEVVYANANAQQQTGGPSGSGLGMGNSTDAGDNGQLPGLNSLQSQVQMIIRREQSERGCSIDEICQSLRSIAPKAIRDAIEFLSVEGLIYSTIDDEHFQATDG